MNDDNFKIIGAVPPYVPTPEVEEAFAPTRAAIEALRENAWERKTRETRPKCPLPKKRLYRTYELAEQARLGHDEPDRLRVYLCECGTYHLTSQVLLGIFQHPEFDWRLMKRKDGMIVLHGVKKLSAGKAALKFKDKEAARALAQFILDRTEEE